MEICFKNRRPTLQDGGRQPIEPAHYRCKYKIRTSRMRISKMPCENVPLRRAVRRSGHGIKHNPTPLSIYSSIVYTKLSTKLWIHIYHLSIPIRLTPEHQSVMQLLVKHLD